MKLIRTLSHIFKTIVLFIPLVHFGCSQPEDSTLRVMTFNIHHCEGVDSVYSVERIAQFMADQMPDIILCQEVDRGFSERSDYEDQPFLLTEMLGYKSFFGPNINDIYGNLILTRFPFLEVKNMPLPNPENKEPRGIISAVVNIKGRSFSLLNTHLCAFSETNRNDQIQYLRKLLKELTRPVIFGADFNAKPSEQLKPLLDDCGLISTRRLLNIEEGIDDILVPEHLEKYVIRGKIVETHISDHAAYWIDLDLGKMLNEK